jgi:hypothetical protein
MPTAKDPMAHEWFVYQFEVKGVPFYVGIGRSDRALDRVRWVCSQIKRELAGKPVKWVLHTCVTKSFILPPESIKYRYVATGFTVTKRFRWRSEESCVCCQLATSLRTSSTIDARCRLRTMSSAMFGEIQRTNQNSRYSQTRRDGPKGFDAARVAGRCGKLILPGVNHVIRCRS